MAITGKTPKFKSLKQQKLDGELGLIIDEMGRAMWSANKEAIANGMMFTPNMEAALAKFHWYCKEHYGKKA